MPTGHDLGEDAADVVRRSAPYLDISPAALPLLPAKTAAAAADRPAGSWRISCKDTELTPRAAPPHGQGSAVASVR